MRLQTKNDEVAGVQYVRHANFDFGDNTPDATSAGLSTQHRYENPGKYDINASFTVEVAPNVQGTVPNGYIVDCPVKSVTIN